MNKKFLHIILLLLISVGSYAQEFTGGDGTAENPYQIASVADLQLLDGDSTLWRAGNNFILTANIDMDGETFHPIGWREALGSEHHFKGSIDGNYHIISNLTVTPHPEQDFLFGGFIGSGQNAVIKNLGFKNINVDFSSIGNSQRVGGLVGQLEWAASSIENCFLLGGEVKAAGGVGGLVGKFNGNSISNCLVDVKINASWLKNNGGLTGDKQNALAGTTISNSVFYGTVVKGEAAIGVGGTAGSATVEGVYAISTTGQPNTVSGVTILNSEELLQSSNYPNLDFTDEGYWMMRENSFAVLKGFGEGAFDGILTYISFPITVTQSDGTTPVEGANVAIDGMNYTTDAEGQIDYLVLPGTYTYEVSADGYKTTEGSVEAVVGGEPKIVALVSDAVEVYKTTFNLVDSKDQVLIGATIQVTDDNTYNETMTSDEMGAATFEQMLPGTYTYTISKTLFVTQEGTFEITDMDQTMNVTVQIDNQAPTANAGVNALIGSRTVYELNGSGSFDPNADELTYNWSAPEGITLSDATIANPTFTAPDVVDPTDYIFTLVVNDGELSSEEAQVTISVKSAIILGKELLVNGGFEQGLIEGWKGLEQTDGITITLSDEVPTENSESTKSLRIESSGQIGGTHDTPKEIATADAAFFDLTVGKSYILKGKVKADAMTFNVINLRLMPNNAWFDGAKVAVTNPSLGWGVPVVIGEWVEFEKEIEITESFRAEAMVGDVISSKLNILPSANSSEAILYFDDLSLMENDIELVVHAGDDITVEEGNEVGLSGQYNSSEDLSVLWSCDALSITNAETLMPSFIAPLVDEDTEFTVTLSVQKGALTVEDQVVITVLNTQEKELPIAKAGDDQMVNEGDEVTLDGSSSTPAGAVLTWTAPEGITLSDVNASMPTFTAPQVDEDMEYTFTLTVTYGEETSTDEVVVTVKNVAEVIMPMAKAGDDQMVNEGDEVTLDGSSSIPAEAVLTWTAPEGITLSDVNASMPTFTAPQVDEDMEYTFTLTVTYGEESSTDEVVVTVKNVAEVIIPVANAGTDQTVESGVEVMLDGSLSTPAEAVLTWTAPEGITLSAVNTAKPTFTAPVLEEEVMYTFTLKVSYEGQESSDEVTITVKAKEIVNSVEDLASQLAIAYPNPTYNQLTLDLTDKAEVSILQTSGQLVDSTSLPMGKNTIDLSNYSNGIYLIQVKTENASKVIRVVKK